MNDDGVKQAFAEVRDGRCPEFVICDPILDANFLTAARQRGIQGTDAEINTALINLRKQNKLKDCPTTQRKKPNADLHHYRTAVLNAIRLVERQFQKNVDEVICDPSLRAQFDALVQFLCPGTSSFEAGYTALSLRKANQLKPEPVGQVIRAIGSQILPVNTLDRKLRELPTKPGVYIFFDEDTTLYAGKADSLRARIADHIATWTWREMIRQVQEKRRPPAFLVYHELPCTISAKELAAYETELIRSRNPAHNRAGSESKTP